MNKKKKFSLKIKEYRSDPILFFREVLKFEPDRWQENVAIDIANNPKVSVRSGQGVGKTGIEAALTLWFLTCFPYSRVVATAPTRQQLNDVLWSEIAKWLDRSPILPEVLTWTKTYIYMNGQQKRWFATARTATKAESMQGFHEDNMLFIVDEASGISDEIMEAILGTLSGRNNKLLMCGNPTRTSGTFYDSHTSDRGLYKIHKVSSLESDRTNKDNINSLIRKYGRDSNVVRVRVDGEFPLQEDDVFIQITDVENSINLEVFKNDEQEKAFIPEKIDIGVDVARFGDDETVIAIKTDNIIQPLISKRGQDLMRTVGDVVRIANKIKDKYSPKRILARIDDTGLGGGVTDRLKEIVHEQSMDWLVIIPVNFASGVPKGVKDAEYYSDISTYMWSVLRDILKEKQLKLPNDSELVAQLSSRKYNIESSGKIKIEPKKEMKKRCLNSPDRADAVVLACMPVKVKGE